MATPDTQAPNYTQIPNVFIDYWMSRLTMPEFIILMVIARNTFGWHVKKTELSLNAICNVSSIEKKAVLRALSSLEKRGLITSKKRKKGNVFQTNSYQINVLSIPELPQGEKMGGSGSEPPRGSGLKPPRGSGSEPPHIKKRKEKKRNPLPSVSPKKSVAPAPSEVAAAPVSPSLPLGSEEEELFNELKEKGLTRKDCRRLLGQYSGDAIRSVAKQLESIPVKSSFMGLLFDALRDPSRYSSGRSTLPLNEPTQMAKKYNEMLKDKGFGLAYERNIVAIEDMNCVFIYVSNRKGFEQVSLSSSYALEELKQAIIDLQNVPLSV